MGMLRGAVRAAGRARRDESGQALVEFALVIPVVLLLLIALFELGRVWHTYQVITDAAREGARHAAVANPTITRDTVIARVEAALSRGGLRPEKWDIRLEGLDGPTGSADTVEIKYLFEPAFAGPLLGLAVKKRSVTLKTQFVMRNE